MFVCLLEQTDSLILNVWKYVFIPSNFLGNIIKLENGVNKIIIIHLIYPLPFIYKNEGIYLLMLETF